MSAEDVHGTQPIRLVDQRTMEKIFEVVDELGLSRESVRVPLAGEGNGFFERAGDGTWTIVVPESGPLDGFLIRLRAALESGSGD